MFIARYLDLFWDWVSLYNFVMKIFFIASSSYILYLMKVKYRCVLLVSSSSPHPSNPRFLVAHPQISTINPRPSFPSRAVQHTTPR